MRGWVVVSTATAGMASSMLSLYAVSALAPFLVADLRLTRTEVGALVTVSFAVAAVMSLIAGLVVDVMGARAGLTALFATVAGVLWLASFAPNYVWLLAILAVAGIGQALANPATNILVATRVDPARRGAAIGIKQSGVQLAAFVAGLALPAVAATVGWREAIRLLGVIPALLLLALWRWRSARDQQESGSWWQLRAPSPWLGWLMGYSLLLGTALAAVNTYLPLYASQRLTLGSATSGLVLAAFGLSGLFARVLWTGRAARLPKITSALVWLSALAAACVMLVLASAEIWTGFVWVGAIGIGATATAGNAVSMLVVVRQGGAAGHASGMVSLGFFAGFVAGPTSFGALADRLGYGAGWIAVAVTFAISSLVATAIPASSSVSEGLDHE